MSDADRSMSSDGTDPTSDGIRPERVDSRALFMARKNYRLEQRKKLLAEVLVCTL